MGLTWTWTWNSWSGKHELVLSRSEFCKEKPRHCKNQGSARPGKVVNRYSQSRHHHSLNEMDKVKRDHFVIKSMVLLGFYVVAEREACEPINGEFELEDLGTVSRSDHPPPPSPIAISWLFYFQQRSKEPTSGPDWKEFFFYVSSNCKYVYKGISPNSSSNPHDDQWWW